MHNTRDTPQRICPRYATTGPMAALVLCLHALTAASSAAPVAEAGPPSESRATAPQSGESTDASADGGAATKLNQLRALSAQVREHFAQGEYAEAEARCRDMLRLAPTHAGVHYNLACALARLDRREDALAALRDAAARGYDDDDHMQADADLASVRGLQEFARIREQVAANADAAMQRLPIDRAKALQGVRTIERNPRGGLRYRVRMSEQATAAHPHRLVVWLHPSGGSMNATVESLAPRLAKRGFALLVLTQKQFAGWSQDDRRRLETQTLMDAASIEGIDARRPVLFGFSAGGQMALQMWAADPTRYAGVIVDAAYPIDMAAYLRGRVEPMPLPETAGVARTPMLALIGGRDGGLRLWRAVEQPWRDAGVRLTVREVEGKGHAWLIDAVQWRAVEQWLDGLTPDAANQPDSAEPDDRHPATQPAHPTE